MCKDVTKLILFIIALTNCLFGQNVWRRVETGIEHSKQFQDVIYTGTKIVAITNKEILSSLDGKNWNKYQFGIAESAQIFSIVWTGKQYFACGLIGDPIHGLIISSNDGISWKKENVGNIGSVSKIIYDGTNLFVLGESGFFLTSSDGAKWEQHKLPEEDFYLFIDKVGGKLFVGGHWIILSFDTMTFSEETKLSFPFWFYSIAWNSKIYVTVGSAGCTMFSDNAIDWTLNCTETRYGLADIIWDGNYFITIGVAGTILNSIDGKNWKMNSSGVTNNLNSIVVTNNNIYIVGDDATMLVSERNPNATKLSKPNFCNRQEKRKINQVDANSCRYVKSKNSGRGFNILGTNSVHLNVPQKTSPNSGFTP